jgi:type VI secretion system protein VasD
MKFGSRLAWMAFAMALVGVAGCAGTPKPALVKAQFDVQASVNPDSRGRPSPVVVRLYELKSMAAFNGADFFSIYERDKETLGAELLAREEFLLRPGEKRQLERKLQPETTYVGVIAAFRDLEHAQWRGTMAVAPGQVVPVLIKLEGSKISIGAAK